MHVDNYAPIGFSDCVRWLWITPKVGGCQILEWPEVQGSRAVQSLLFCHRYWLDEGY